MAIGDRSSPSPLSVNFFQGASSASESESEDSSPATPVEALPQQQQHQQFLQQHSHIHAPRPVRRNNSLGKGDVRKAVDAAHKTSASVAHAAANASASAMLGARKLRRWEALLSLMRRAEITDEDLQPGYPAPTTAPSAFTQMLWDPAKLTAWYEFLKTSEERQREVLEAHPSSSSSSPTRRVRPSAEQSFARIDRSSRDILRRSNVSSQFVHSLEQDVVAFITKLQQHPSTTTATNGICGSKDGWINVVHREEQSHLDGWEVVVEPANMDLALEEAADDYDPMLIWRLDDAFSRCIAHAVCQYYGIVSHSEDIDGVRVMRVLRPSDDTMASTYLPKTSLSEYLQKCSSVARRWPSPSSSSPSSPSPSSDSISGGVEQHSIAIPSSA